jgi:hypothetical protein
MNPDFKRLLNEEGRWKMIEMLRRADMRCSPASISTDFFCETSCPGDRDAYVNFLAFTNLVTSTGIHICPNFYTNIDADGRILHELGRLSNGLGETGTNTWKDVDVWDNNLAKLCSIATLGLNPPPPIE